MYLCWSINWTMTWSMPLGVPTNWNISSIVGTREYLSPTKMLLELYKRCSRIFTTIVSYYNNIVSTRRAKCCRNTIKHTHSICHISFEKEYGSAYCLFKSLFPAPECHLGSIIFLFPPHVKFDNCECIQKYCRL